MATAKGNKGGKSEQELFEDMLAGLSPEEREAVLRMTGQSEQGGGTKTPVLRVNYNPQADNSGKKIPKGNFVLGQVVKQEGFKKNLIEAGTDLGPVLKATLMKIGTQYSFYNQNSKERCSSQVLLEKSEVPVGSTLKRCCNDGSCPRRKEGLAKEDKCGHQYVLYLKLAEEVELPDGSKTQMVLFYVKGINYKPFQTWLKDEVGKVPTIAFETEVTTEDQGTYFDIIWKKGAALSMDVFRENFQQLSGITSDLLDYKESNAGKYLPAPESDPNAKTGEVLPPEGDAASKARDVTPGAAGINW